MFNLSKTLFPLLITLFLISAAHAREKTGNGGLGFLCESNKSNTGKVYLLDIFEGTLPLYPRKTGYTYPSHATSTDTEISRAISRAGVNPYFQKLLIDSIAEINENKTLLPENAVLEFTDDAFPEISMKHCSRVQIANYVIDERTQKRLDIDKSLFSKMDYLNQAGLIIHEAVYYLLRKYDQVDNSRSARSLTAMLLAEDELSAEILSATEDIFIDTSKLLENKRALKSLDSNAPITVELKLETNGENVRLNAFTTGGMICTISSGKTIVQRKTCTFTYGQLINSAAGIGVSVFNSSKDEFTYTIKIYSQHSLVYFKRARSKAPHIYTGFDP